MKLSDCIDIRKLQKICTAFYSAFGIPHGIMDNEGTWVVSEGWQDACTRFFRVHPETKKLCINSDSRMLQIIGDIRDDYKTDTCDVGLEHVSYPIVIADERVGSFWLGQFFYAPPDLASYRKMAKKYGFDEHDFIHAITRCPVVQRGQIDELMAFFMSFVELITDQGFESLKRKEHEKELLKLKTKLETRVDHLEKILPLCSFCKRIRTVAHQWEEVDAYIHTHFDKDISHSICPECLKKNYPDIAADIERKSRRNAEKKE